MTFRHFTLFLALALVSTPGVAEKADREKPMLLEASKISIDDLKKVQILEGDVVITKGTMVLKAARVVVTEDAYGFQKGVAFAAPGSKATFRQKREGRDDYIEGEAERIVHDARSEKTEFFVRGWVKSGQDEVKGHYISYDALTEQYLVTNAGETKSAKGAPQARVRAIIQPKGKNAPEENTGEPLTLKPDAKVAK